MPLPLPARRLRFRGQGPRPAGAARRRAQLQRPGRERHPAGVLPRRQRDRRADLRGADARRRADALLPDRRQGRRARAAAGGRGPGRPAPRWSCTSPRRRASPARSWSISAWWRSDVTLTRPMADRRQRLVVDRQRHGRRPDGRGDPRPRRRRAVRRSPCSATSRTATTTGSCCPTSWPAARTRPEIFLNALAWYAENGITLHAGRRVTRIDRLRQAGARRRRHSHAVRQADHRHRQPRVHPADHGHRTADGAASTRASSRFRTLDDTRGMIRYARDARARRGDRRRPARPGGGAGPAEPRRRRSTSCTPPGT